MYETTFFQHQVTIETAPGLFSPAHPDAGTLHMLEKVWEDLDKIPAGPALDLGCGAGLVGILLAKERSLPTVMADVDPAAVEIARRNAESNGVSPLITCLQSDGFADISENRFALVLSNPPYHTDFSVAKSFIEGAFRHMTVGGRIYFVTKRLDWYKNKLTSVFGGVRVTAFPDGYYVFVSEKRGEKPPEKKKKTGGSPRPSESPAGSGSRVPNGSTVPGGSEKKEKDGRKNKAVRKKIKYKI